MGYHGCSGKGGKVAGRDPKRTHEAAERLAETALDSYKAAVDRAFAARESNARLTRSFFEEGMGLLEDQAELNRRTLRSLAQRVREQREALQQISQDSQGAYSGFLDSLSSYHHDISEEAERSEGREG
jgi:multidrug efflux pump subunit AcrA (membrane-fusion protein)